MKLVRKEIKYLNKVDLKNIKKKIFFVSRV